MFPYPWKNSGKCADTRDPREGFFSPRGKIPYFKISTHLRPRIRECEIIFRGNASPVNARANSSRQRGDRAWKLSDVVAVRNRSRKTRVRCCNLGESRVEGHC